MSLAEIPSLGQQAAWREKKKKKYGWYNVELWFEAAETDEKPPREWKLEGGGGVIKSVIKSVSQRSVAFSRYTERRARSQEPTASFCHTTKMLSSQAF